MLRAAVLSLLFVSCGFSQEINCGAILKYVYRIEFEESGGRGNRAVRFGGGFFLTEDGDFVTAYHLFEESPRAMAALVGVDGSGDRVFDRPVISISSYSRNLDYVVARVRLAGSKIRVPPVGSGVAIGDRLFGFIVQVRGPVGPQAGRYIRAGVQCTEGSVSAISPRQINARGKGFFGPGSSGSPVFDSSGRVVSIALEMVNPDREARRPDFVYVSLPIVRALKGRKLKEPLPFYRFMERVRRNQ